jgi:release factor glutamine methyltransferase
VTLLEACRYGEEQLRAAGVPEAKLDAWLLLEYVSGCSKSHYYAYQEEQLTEETRKRYLDALGQRSSRVPLQYITGAQEFMGHIFLVNENVLIPRQDTEILVEEALEYLKPGMRFLDLCTGSGCILLSLLLACPEAEGVGSDISPKALETAGKNRDRLMPAAELTESDLFAGLNGPFDLIVSNPPYIPRSELSGLMEEVRDYEPVSALDGHEDGLYFYRRIAEESPSYLVPGGRLYLEIGYDQGHSVPELLREAGFCEIEVKKDLSGLDRVVKGVYPGAGRTLRN